MKKFKLFALAMMAMLSTNAFAQKIQSDGDWKYTDVNAVAKTATLVGLVDSKKGTVEALKIPATVSDEGGAEYTITKIGAGAFQGDEAILTVTFTTSITEIGESAFADASSLTKVTFPKGSALATIGNAAFANTFSLEKLDFSNTKVYDLSKVTPFVDGKISNVALEEVKLPAKATAIGTAFAGLRALKKLNIGDTKVTAIVANAFAGDKNFTALVLPAVYKYDEDTGEQLTTPNPTTLAEDALAGSYIQTLTINGMVEKNGILATGATTLTALTFNGEVQTGAITAGAFADNTKLATVTFNGNVGEAAIVGGSFTNCATGDDGAKALTFTIAAGKASKVVFADQTAFAAKEVEATKCNVAISAPDEAVNIKAIPYRATFSPTVPAATKVYVYGTKTYYGKYINSGDVEVNIKRSDATVYSAYVDGTKVYMDPLQVVNGNQIIAKKQCVIVKTTSPKTADGKSYIEISALPKGHKAGTHTMRIDADENVINSIQGLYGMSSPNYKLAADLKDKECAADEALYVVGDLTEGLKWQTPKDNVKLYNNTLYVVAKAAAAAGRLEVVWLDGSEEEATAIKSVKTVKEDGAIYNLAGQKVSASYKGVVIKDGKKYIQK